MSETIPDLRGLPRREAYAELKNLIRAVLDGIEDEIAAMATISSFLHHSLGFLWTGFYRVVKPESLLRIGPYQGSLGCLEIEFGKGVCGQTAATRETIIVPDVQLFEGYITCDSRCRSEIVVPVFNGARRLIAVLDVDSESVGTFGAEDRNGLEDILRWFAE